MIYEKGFVILIMADGHDIYQNCSFKSILVQSTILKSRLTYVQVGTVIEFLVRQPQKRNLSLVNLTWYGIKILTQNLMTKKLMQLLIMTFFKTNELRNGYKILIFVAYCIIPLSKSFELQMWKLFSNVCFYTLKLVHSIWPVTLLFEAQI